jgi:KDO2-lipid IV(A) lauroyltransferase
VPAPFSRKKDRILPPTPDSRPPDQLRDRPPVLFRLVLTVRAVLGFLPAPVLRGLYRGLAALAYRFDGKGKRRALRNLAAAYPDRPADEHAHIARASYRGAVEACADFLWLDKAAADIDNEDVLRQALDGGKGACLVALHLGNWETLPATLHRKGYDVRTLLSTPRREWAQKMDTVRRLYDRAGLRHIRRGGSEGLMDMMKALRGGTVLVFFADQYAEDVAVTFFGRETMAPAGAAALGVLMGAPVLLALTWRDEDGNNRIRFEPVEIARTGDRTADIQANVQALLERMELAIRERPEQWLWQYNRWR